MPSGDTSDVAAAVMTVPNFTVAITLAGDTARAATTDEVKDLRPEAGALKEGVADLTLENRLLKKSMIAAGENDA